MIEQALVLARILPEKKSNDGKTYYTTYILRDICNKEYALHLRNDFKCSLKHLLIVKSVWRDIELEIFNSSKINTLKFTSFNIMENYCGTLKEIKPIYDSLSLKIYQTEDSCRYTITTTTNQIIVTDNNHPTSTEKVDKIQLLTKYQISL